MSVNKLEMEEDDIELNFSDDEKGEKLVEEADLNWGSVRQSKKEHFCYRKRRPIALWAFSIAMIGFIILLVSLGVGLIEEHDSEVDITWGYTDMKTEKFRTAPIIVPAGDHKHGFFYDVPRPKGDIMIRAITIDIIDEAGNSVPLEQVYNHHLFLGAVFNETFRIIGAVGAEGARIPVKLPKPYGVPSRADEAWVMSYELINQWGLASGADMKVFLSYEVSYTPNIQPANVVNWRLLGLNFEEENKTFEWDIPGQGGLNSVVKLEHEYEWGPIAGTTVFSWGHIHIGAINNTLYDVSDPNKAPEVVCVSIPKYSSTGFINSIVRKDRVHTFPKDGKFRITSYYDNSKNYGKVMSLTSTYTSADSGSSSDPDEDIRRRNREFEKRRTEELVNVLGLYNSALTSSDLFKRTL